MTARPRLEHLLRRNPRGNLPRSSWVRAHAEIGSIDFTIAQIDREPQKEPWLRALAEGRAYLLQQRRQAITDALHKPWRKSGPK